MKRQVAFWLSGILLLVLAGQQGMQRRPVHVPEANRYPSDGGAETGSLSPERIESVVAHVPKSSLPAQTSCEDAIAIVREFRALRVEPVTSVDEKKFGEALVDWIDPHGFWAIGKSAAPGEYARRHAKELLAAIESSDCEPYLQLAEVLERWVKERRDQFEASLVPVLSISSPESEPLVVEAELDAPPATQLERLGNIADAFHRAFGDRGQELVRESKKGLFPALSVEGWKEVALTSAVRAYIGTADAHSAWAPREEETSILDVGLHARPPVPLWGEGTRTLVGLRIDGGAREPLRDGDVLVRIGTQHLGGMSLEQIEQLAIAAEDNTAFTDGEWIRNGLFERGALSGRTRPDGGTVESIKSAELEWIGTGDKEIASLRIYDVRDDLGEEALPLLRAVEERNAEALVIDLRGNAGGAMDGAVDFLGYFLPDAPLFPMRRRDTQVEFETAPPGAMLVTRPVAVLVDGGTASAAEMIAGALQSYGRAEVAGALTFGKGCAQDYFPDSTTRGVLKVTTLTFALPNGAPLQKVGILPDLAFPFPFPADLMKGENEAKIPNSPHSWRGPDLRGASLQRWKGTRSWPALSGKTGPCSSPDLCRAVDALSARAKKLSRR